MGKLTFLADPDADTKTFSQYLVLLTIFLTEPTTFEKLQQNLKRAHDKFSQILENYVIFFGSDKDPHRPGNITLGRFIQDNIGFKYIEMTESEGAGRLLWLTDKGRQILIENLNFFTKYIKENARK